MKRNTPHGSIWRKTANFWPERTSHRQIVAVKATRQVLRGDGGFVTKFDWEYYLLCAISLAVAVVGIVGLLSLAI
jgi:hypothetical protein